MRNLSNYRWTSGSTKLLPFSKAISKTWIPTEASSRYFMQSCYRLQDVSMQVFLKSVIVEKTLQVHVSPYMIALKIVLKRNKSMLVSELASNLDSRFFKSLSEPIRQELLKYIMIRSYTPDDIPYGNNLRNEI